jgi:hypothetical protein
MFEEEEDQDCEETAWRRWMLDTGANLRFHNLQKNRWIFM